MARGEIVLLADKRMERAVQKTPVPKRGKKAAPRPEKTYEVKYIVDTDPSMPWSFRIKCPELTRAQLTTARAIVGQVSWALPNGKWTPFTRGVLDTVQATQMRFIREIGEHE